MVGDEGSATDEHPVTGVDASWRGLLHRTGGDSDPADGQASAAWGAGEPECHEVELRAPRDADLPRRARWRVSSTSRARLAAVLGLCVLLAALVLIALLAVRTGDPSSSSGRVPSGRAADLVVPARGARGARAKGPARLGARRWRRARAERRERRASRRDGAPARNRRVEPPARAEAGAPSVLPPAVPAPESSLPEEPASPPASRPRAEGGLIDGSRSSAEFGL
jgi:hypothetical protein